MSVLAPAPRPVDAWRRPSLFRLLAAVLAGEVVGALALWCTAIVFELLRLAPIGGAQQWYWLPWSVDGIWALAGAIGWGYLVCSLIARLVAERIERRGYGRPAAGWLRIAIAISGYGGMAVGHNGGTHVLVAVAGGAVVIRLVAFNLDGSLRAWRWHKTARWQLAAAVGAALLGFSYSALHSFAADGSGGSFGDGSVTTRVGHTEMISAGLIHFRLPVAITSVAFTGPGAQHLRVSGLVISPNPGTMLIPQRERSYPGAHHWADLVWQPTRLPYRASAGNEIWINENVALSSCGDVTVNSLKLNYTVLGISTSETIPLQTPLSLRCGRL